MPCMVYLWYWVHFHRYKLFFGFHDADLYSMSFDMTWGLYHVSSINFPIEHEGL